MPILWLICLKWLWNSFWFVVRVLLNLPFAVTLLGGHLPQFTFWKLDDVSHKFSILLGGRFFFLYWEVISSFTEEGIMFNLQNLTTSQTDIHWEELNLPQKLRGSSSFTEANAMYTIRGQSWLMLARDIPKYISGLFLVATIAFIHEVYGASTCQPKIYLSVIMFNRSGTYPR